MRIYILIAGVLILLAELAQASKPILVVPSCENLPELFSSQEVGATVKNLESLPRMVFVAKHARYYVESKKHSFQLVSHQSFVKGESKILCSTPSNVVEKSFSLYAPTLIDMTENKKVGDSFWQFHVSVGKTQLGVWNQKTRLFKSKDIEKSLAQEGVQIRILQASNDEFEMIFTRDNNEFSEKLSIRFDAINKIP